MDDPKKPFDASQFASTAIHSAQDKARFANSFIGFIESGFKWKLFSNQMYTFLNRSFGHIPHRNRAGFFDVWFATLHHQVQWFMHALNWETVGKNPESSNSDVEEALKREFLAKGYYQRLRAELGASRSQGALAPPGTSERHPMKDSEVSKASPDFLRHLEEVDSYLSCFTGKTTSEFADYNFYQDWEDGLRPMDTALKFACDDEVRKANGLENAAEE